MLNRWIAVCHLMEEITDTF